MFFLLVFLFLCLFFRSGSFRGSILFLVYFFVSSSKELDPTLYSFDFDSPLLACSIMSTLRKKSKSPREVPKKSPKAPKSPKKSKGSTINYPPSSSSTGSTNSAPSFPSVQEVKQSNYGTIFDAAKKGDVVQLTTLLNKGLGLLGRDDEVCSFKGMIFLLDGRGVG